MTERGILFLLIFSWCLLLVLPGESLMPTLNRFPLLGLWAEEAARRIGYTKGEAEALGHAYAVLYAIRKNRLEHPREKSEKKPAAAGHPAVQRLRFGGDELDVTYDDNGKVRGRVGGD